ncbi:MAG: CHAD domain-containing protein [Alphaproteobacteria bacterium]
MAVRRRTRSPGELAPAATVGARAIDVVTRQAGLVRANLAAAIDGRDPEGVHDMRVASRRLRASLAVLEPWLPASDLARVNPALRSVTRALGAVREIDVDRALLARMRVRSTPARAIALEDVDARLVRRLRRARTRMMGRFARVDLDRLDDRLARLVEHLRASALAAAASRPLDAGPELAASEGAGTGSADEPPIETWFFPGPQAGRSPAGAPVVSITRHPVAPISELLREVGERAEAAAAAIVSHPVPPAIGSPEAHEALHRVRIATKKLRYLVEIVAPELGSAGSALVKRLRGLQDHMGDFHDDVVLDAELADAIRRASNRGRRLLASELRRLRRNRHRALVRDEQAVREALDELRARDFAADLRAAFATALAPRPAPERGDAAASPAPAGDRAAGRA